MDMESNVNSKAPVQGSVRDQGIWGREIRKMDGEIWREKRRKRHDAMKSSFIDAVSINYNAYMQNTWE